MSQGETYAILRFGFRSPIPVGRVQEILQSLERAYEGLLAFFGIVEDVRALAARWRKNATRTSGLPPEPVPWIYWWPASYGGHFPSAKHVLDREERLQLHAAEFREYAGSWEFSGRAEVLELVRQWCRDCWEEKCARLERGEKDYGFGDSREWAERALQENPALKERLDLLKELGVPTSEVWRLGHAYVWEPLGALAGFAEAEEFRNPEIVGTFEKKRKKART